jgi:hypothetical protein
MKTGVWKKYFYFLSQLQIILFLSFFSFSLAEAASLESIWYDERAVNEGNVPADLEQELRGKHVIFVDGLMNELASVAGNYFSDNIQEVKRLKMTYSHLSFPSSRSIPDNAYQLGEDIMQIYLSVRKPLILIGHSMGGAEVLYSILMNPDLLIFDFVEKVVLIEAAIGGSILAENMKDNFLARRVRDYLGEGLNSLKPQQAHSNFKYAFRYFQNSLKSTFQDLGPKGIEEAFDRLSGQVYYVRSYIPDDEPVSWGVRAVLFFCEKDLMKRQLNDGLLSTVAQLLNLKAKLINRERSFGTDLGILKADHVELVISGIFSESTGDIRRAFTRAVFRKIYEKVEFASGGSSKKQKASLLESPVQNGSDQTWSDLLLRDGGRFSDRTLQ